MFGSSYVGPQYTIRLLLKNVETTGNENINLKPFSHFTLGCTLNDETEKVSASFEILSKFLKGPVSFKAEGIVNLGSESRPLWGIKFNIGSEKEGFRNEFGKLFDPLMCKERNGILYLWNQGNNQEQRCAHMTLGQTQEDKEKAEKLLNCKFTFDQMDYKKIGPHDPHLSMSLKNKPVNTLGPF